MRTLVSGISKFIICFLGTLLLGVVLSSEITLACPDPPCDPIEPGRLTVETIAPVKDEGFHPAVGIATSSAGFEACAPHSYAPKEGIGVSVLKEQGSPLYSDRGSRHSAYSGGLVDLPPDGSAPLDWRIQSAAIEQPQCWRLIWRRDDIPIAEIVAGQSAR